MSDDNKTEQPEKDKGGRPKIVFDEVMTAKVEGMAAMMTVAQMGDYFGCCETTMHEVFKRQPEVSEAYKRGRATIIAMVAQNLITKAKSGDTASMVFFLKTQAGWKETSVLDHTSTDRTMSPAREMTEQEIADELAKRGINTDIFDN
jgi:hypothetical protein